MTHFKFTGLLLATTGLSLLMLWQIRRPDLGA